MGDSILSAELRGWRNPGAEVWREEASKPRANGVIALVLAWELRRVRSVAQRASRPFALMPAGAGEEEREVAATDLDARRSPRSSSLGSLAVRSNSLLH